MLLEPPIPISRQVDPVVQKEIRQTFPTFGVSLRLLASLALPKLVHELLSLVLWRYIYKVRLLFPKEPLKCVVVQSLYPLVY